ncbi:MAG: hypothetical protein JWO84_733 [Parcubacteria group bacterium]|nr:hypothetical protein [Parcubacteria group bacterium]
MDELTLDNKKYLSSKRAAQITGYAKDYVGQLCREGRVTARLVGRNWYVLETSILEHRFGAEDEVSSAPNPPQDLEATWEAPKYMAEIVQAVPNLVPKASAPLLVEPVPLEAPKVAPEPLESPTALADMQSAWQEWFQSQEQEEKLLPDASEMLLEAPEEVPLLPVRAVEEQERPIHIERIQTPVEHFPARNVDRAEQSVSITRSQVRPQLTMERSSRAATPIAPASTGRTVRLPRKGNAVVQSLFLSLAGLSIVVAAIGTGAADKFLDRNTTISPVTDFIGGVHSVQK